MAWRDRIRDVGRRINDRLQDWFGGEQPGDLPPLPPEEPPEFPGGEPPEPPEPPDEPPELPPEEPEEPIGGDPLIEVYDAFNNYVGTDTWEGWWNRTLVGLSYNDLMYLVGAIENTLDIDWPWPEWREAYRQIHGG